MWTPKDPVLRRWFAFLDDCQRLIRELAGRGMSDEQIRLTCSDVIVAAEEVEDEIARSAMGEGDLAQLEPLVANVERTLMIARWRVGAGGTGGAGSTVH